jgi:hypothetical protein
LDPDDLMNPMKVFGGRVTAGFESKVLGFLLGFSLVLLVSLVGPNLLGWDWLAQILNSNLVQPIPIPIWFFVSLAGGLAGLLVIRLMTLNLALSIGIPFLRIMSKILRK